MESKQNKSFIILSIIGIFFAATYTISLSASAAPFASIDKSKNRSTKIEKIKKIKKNSSTNKNSKSVKKKSSIKKLKTIKYTVKTGDSLGAIALSHNVTIHDIITANKIENPDKISEGTTLDIPGQKIKKKRTKKKKKSVRIVVPKGITLSRIAELYKVSLKTIVRTNKIKNPDHLKAGQKLIIPGVDKIVELIPPPPCYKAPVDIYRVRTNETKTLSLCFCDGSINPEAAQELSSMTGPVGKKAPFPLHPKLIKMIQKVAEHFAGKRIEIISGQRVRKSPGHESYHNKGQALDYRVQDVSNKRLANYVRAFNNVGVGYYPNSVFIHMDTRKKDSYWIDYSRPGEKSIYGRAGMTKSAINAIRAKRAEKHADKNQPIAKENSNLANNIESTSDKEDITKQDILEKSNINNVATHNK